RTPQWSRGLVLAELLDEPVDGRVERRYLRRDDLDAALRRAHVREVLLGGCDVVAGLLERCAQLLLQVLGEPLPVAADELLRDLASRVSKHLIELRDGRVEDRLLALVSEELLLPLRRNLEARVLGRAEEAATHLLLRSQQQPVEEPAAHRQVERQLELRRRDGGGLERRERRGGRRGKVDADEHEVALDVVGLCTLRDFLRGVRTDQLLGFPDQPAVARAESGLELVVDEVLEAVAGRKP